MKLKNYLQDGAGYQSRAILAHLQAYTQDMDVEVGRWENGREQFSDQSDKKITVGVTNSPMIV